MNVESTDTNPITDINIDFDVFQVDDSSTNVESDLNSYCDSSDSDENELGILDNLLQSNDNSNSVPDIINSSKLHQQIERLSNKIDRLASMTNINRHALEPYAAKSGQFFPPDYMKKNLLDIMATDYADYARQLLRILYTSYELKNSILPPGRSHLKREPLDPERFKLLTGRKIICPLSLFLFSFWSDAIRIKFRLDETNFGLFYRSLLRRKLTDFLIEERRRDSIKEIRHIHKQNQQQSSSSLDEAFD
ncbi:unnamed protein product [Rotaria sp. Silwood2]|nr:unnamed protein product [Rotaria sp. Silwood2]CAF2885262.1 unnamed protein product [Rotaria sp. Silwood2]CAF3492480.1 unnamed protein product [Rotaria sp. Silwood2]